MVIMTTTKDNGATYHDSNQRCSLSAWYFVQKLVHAFWFNLHNNLLRKPSSLSWFHLQNNSESMMLFCLAKVTMSMSLTPVTSDHTSLMHQKVSSATKARTVAMTDLPGIIVQTISRTLHLGKFELCTYYTTPPSPQPMEWPFTFCFSKLNYSRHPVWVDYLSFFTFLFCFAQCCSMCFNSLFL
jgi:hypothetical protein